MAIDIEYHRKYLKKIKNLRASFEDQVQKGWFRWSDLKSLDDHDLMIEAYEKAIDVGNDVFILLEKKLLDDSLIKIADEIMIAKRRTSIEILKSKNVLN